MTQANFFKAFFILSVSLIFSACSSVRKDSQENSEKISKATEEAKSAQALKDSLPALNPLAVSQEISWNSFEVMIIQLDKNKQPQKSAKANFNAEVNAYPFGQGPNFPKINISTFSLAGSSTQNKDSLVNAFEDYGNGRVVQLSCGTTDLKQKFDNPNLLKNWAVEFNCSKNRFFVIINNKK